jgi:hypothetical protein
MAQSSRVVPWSGHPREADVFAERRRERDWRCSGRPILLQLAECLLLSPAPAPAAWAAIDFFRTRSAAQASASRRAGCVFGAISRGMAVLTPRFGRNIVGTLDPYRPRPSECQAPPERLLNASRSCGWLLPARKEALRAESPLTWRNAFIARPRSYFESVWEANLLLVTVRNVRCRTSKDIG